MEDIPCSHGNEDGICTCTLSVDSDDMGVNKATPDDTVYVCDHSDGRGCMEEMKEVPRTHSCELYESTSLEMPPVEKPLAGNPPQKNEMVKDTAYDRAVALFKALLSVDSTTEKTMEEQKDKLTVQTTAVMDALEDLSNDGCARLTGEHDSLLAVATTLQAVTAGTATKMLVERPIPTAEKIGMVDYVFVSGSSLILAAGSTNTSKTVIYIDRNGNGEIDSSDVIFSPNMGGATDGTVAGNNLKGRYIFGSCRNDNVDGDIQLTMLGEEVSYLFGGGYAMGADVAVSGSASVNVLGGKVLYLYGGDRGRGGRINSIGSTNVYTGSDATVRNGYDGGENTVLRGDAIVTVEGIATGVVYGGDSGDGTAERDTQVMLKHGARVGSVCGGGSLNIGTTEGSTFVTIESGAIVNSIDGDGIGVVGGGSSTVSGRINVTIAGTVVGEAYGGGSGLVAQGASVTLQSGARVSDRGAGVYGGGLEDTVIDGTFVTIKAGAMMNATYSNMYGGVFGNGWTMVGGGTSVATDREVASSVYSGGYLGTVTGDISVTIGNGAKTRNSTSGNGVIVNGSSGNPVNSVSSISIARNSHLSDGIEVYIVLSAGHVAGGTIATGAMRGDTDRIKPIDDGATDKVAYFENGEIRVGAPPVAIPFVVNEKNICVNGCEFKLEEGTGGVGTVYTVVKYRPMGSEDENDYRILNINGTIGNNDATGYDLTVYTLYDGKSSRNLVDNTSAIMTGGQMDTIYGGSCSGSVSLTGNTKVAMTGGRVNYIYGGGNNAKVTDSTKISVMGSTKVVGSIHGDGSDGRTVSDNAAITVGGAAEIGGAGVGVVINGGTGTLVANSVDSLVVSGGLTGTDSSVCIILPKSVEDGKTIATEAAADNTSKIKLDGLDAVSNTTEFSSSNNITVVELPIAFTDAQKITLMKSSIEIAFKNLAVTNTTTVRSIFNTARAAILHDIVVAWDSTGSSGKTEATEAIVRIVTDTLRSTPDNESGTVVINKSIAKLPGGDSSDSDLSSEGSSGGGLSSSDSSAETRPDDPIESEIKIDGTAGGVDSFRAELPQKAVGDAIKKMEEGIRKKGSLNNGITLVLNISTGGGSTGNVSVNLPKVTQRVIISNKIVNTVLVMDSPSIKIDMNLTTAAEIHRQVQTDVNITVTQQDNNRPAGAIKTVIGNRPVFDPKADYGNDKQMIEFGTGSVSVTILYTLQSDETSSGVCVVYVDSNGNVNHFINSAYDSANKTLYFTTSYSSTYGTGHEASSGLSGTASCWTEENIQFVVNCGLLDGMGHTIFSPDTATTRGMTVTALGKLARIDVSGYKTSSFIDVKVSAYYMGYVEWASQNRILSGIGVATYAPDSTISREQMAVVLADYARIIGYSLPGVHTEITFANTTNIPSWVKDSVETMQMAGTIASKDTNKFEPQSAATRTEASATLRRFMERMMGIPTTQGWTQNNNDQWMHCIEGSPIKGQTRETDSAPYTSDNHGITPDYSKKKMRLIHTVRTGGNLWKIAWEYNVDIQMLVQINGKSIASIIHLDEVLKVPQ